MDEKATEEGIRTENECDNDNAKAQHGVTNETATVEGESTGNNGDTKDNNVEGGKLEPMTVRVLNQKKRIRTLL